MSVINDQSSHHRKEENPSLDNLFFFSATCRKSRHQEKGIHKEALLEAITCISVNSFPNNCYFARSSCVFLKTLSHAAPCVEEEEERAPEFKSDREAQQTLENPASGICKI